ncbi:MAG: CDP-alcohol phosphatidyltransferase family protein [Actinomycetes bacterium]
MERAEFYEKWSALHGNVPVTGIVKGWLGISYAISKLLNKARISPNVITIGGLVFAILLWRFNDSWWAPIFLALSLLCDGLDGSVAIASNSDSVRGAVLDSVIDRLAEVFWALAFYAIGAHLQIVFLAWLLAGTQEYARARMGGLGVRETGIVSVAERPVRASLLAIALVASLLNLNFVEPLALIWLGMQAWSFISVLRYGYNKSRNN